MEAAQPAVAHFGSASPRIHSYPKSRDVEHDRFGLECRGEVRVN